MPAPATKRTGTASSADPVAHERWCWILVALVGQTVTATLSDGVRVTGILAAATPDAGDLSVALRQAVVSTPPKKGSAAPATESAPKPSLVLNGKDLLQLEAAHANVDFTGQPSPATTPAATPRPEQRAGDSFRTDTDISRASQLGKERQLQAWGAGGGGGGGIEDDGGIEGGLEDGGLGRSVNANGFSKSGSRRGGPASGGGTAAGGGAWDQFAANERAFGLRTDYDDEIYTTRLDRSSADFKQREARAAQLEREILKGSTSSALAQNAHVAEERGEQLADALDEEERYGAVIRSPTEGAYVPPGARKAALARLQQNGGQASPVPASSGSASPAPATGPASAAAATPASSTLSASTPAAPPSSVSPNTTATTSTKPNPNAKPYDRSMQEFVHSERVRLEQRRAQMQQAQQQSQQQAQLKKEHDSKLASLLQWSQTFKNPYPLPDEVAQILGKKPAAAATTDGKAPVAAAASPATAAAAATSPKAAPVAAKPAAGGTKITKAMVLEIPPFDPNRAKAKQAALAIQKGAADSTATAAPTSTTATTTTEVKAPAAGLAAKKLSATSAAFVFKPNPAAASFTPGASSATSASTTAARRPSATSTTSAATAAPAPAAAPAPSTGEVAPKVPVNPFFGTKQIKKGSSSMHVKEDFTPFKNGVLPEPATVPPSWPFTGKPYRSIYPVPPQGPLDDGAGGMIDPNNAAAIAAAQQQAHAQAFAVAAAAGGMPINMLPGHVAPPPQQQPPPPPPPPPQQPFVTMSAGGSISGSPASMPPPPPVPAQSLGGPPHLHLPPHSQPPQQFAMYGHTPMPPHQFAHQQAQQQFNPAAAAAMGYVPRQGGGGSAPPHPPQQQQQMAQMNAPGPGPQFQPHHGHQPPHHQPPLPPQFFGQPGPGFVPGPNQGHPPHGPQMLSSPHMPHAVAHSPRLSGSAQGGRGPPPQQQQQPPPMPWTPQQPPPHFQSGTPGPNGGPPPHP